MSKFLLSLVYLSLLILFQSITEVESQNARFNPSKRGAHTATLIDDKLYILGGYSLSNEPNETVGRQFFYLDVSKSFSTQNIQWMDLTSFNSDVAPPPPPHMRAASVRGGANNKTLFLFGGNPIAGEMELVYTFDTQSSLWSVPKITGDYHPLNKSSLFSVIGNNGKMYLFGGFIYDYWDDNNYASDMAILDTVNLRFERGSTNNALVQGDTMVRSYYRTKR